ncbi:hypothetical protein AVEN_270204-1 [Araneus ventricosus]|uniref:Uncharacterized protein n=1 Tax=Araneus ventricosus TaxID=182803 RepID=A0A4Y2FXH2_ARAVE|nr:hypothetical protein AVEN_270204-1 [Araneus ventricosus]
MPWTPEVLISLIDVDGLAFYGSLKWWWFVQEKSEEVGGKGCLCLAGTVFVQKLPSGGSSSCFAFPLLDAKESHPNHPIVA